MNEQHTVGAQGMGVVLSLLSANRQEPGLDVYHDLRLQTGRARLAHGIGIVCSHRRTGRFHTKPHLFGFI